MCKRFEIYKQKKLCKSVDLFQKSQKLSIDYYQKICYNFYR